MSTPTLGSDSSGFPAGQQSHRPASVSAVDRTDVPRWPATARSLAEQAARAMPAKNDPFAPVPSPYRRKPSWAPVKRSAPGVEPSTRSAASPFATPSTLIPPPPPAVATGAAPAEESLPVSELPEPPEKPPLVSQLRLVGLIGDRAMFTLDDAELRRANRWPYVVCLSPGESFETVKLLSTSADDVTLEESGQTTLVDLPRIR